MSWTEDNYTRKLIWWFRVPIERWAYLGILHLDDLFPLYRIYRMIIDLKHKIV